MRRAELLNVFFFTVFTALAWLRRLPLRRRITATRLGLAGVALSILPQFADTSHGMIPMLRDWLPAVQILLAYWQTGTFTVERKKGLEQKLEEIDRKLFHLLPGSRADRTRHKIFNTYLELSYLLCYPLIPAGLALVYLSGNRTQADWYWAIVLPSTYLCYVAVPFIQVLPPRLLNRDTGIRERTGAVRQLNLWLLRHASIQFATFPSAHVASTMAASLALLWLFPLAGIIFLMLSVSIAFSAVAGRYHYAIDVLLGAAIAVTIFLAESG
jgi:membrane-associated phospholipid phosphatase